MIFFSRVGGEMGGYSERRKQGLEERKSKLNFDVKFGLGQAETKYLI